MRLKDRIEIYRLLWEWKTQKDIAKIIWYGQWTISKELKKKEVRQAYNPLYAEKIRLKSRRLANKKQRKLENNKDVWERIKYKLESKEEDRSPDTIIWRIREEIECSENIRERWNSRDEGKIWGSGSWYGGWKMKKTKIGHARRKEE